MRSAKLTIAKYGLLLFVVNCLQSTAYAQENSPYSRYGMGDVVPNHNIFSRGMGGVAAGVQDYNGLFQSLNFTNPASLGKVSVTIFDVSAEADSRTLKTTNPPGKYTQTNSLFSSLQMAFPLTTKKMAKKGNAWALSFGLRPVTRIGYKLEKDERLTNIDSLHTIYEGDGGINQAYVGTGLKIHNFSIGAIAGYMFGNKNYDTKVIFINDTVEYYKAVYSSKTTFGGVFVNAGVQYNFPLKNGDMICFGLYGGVQQKLQATRDVAKETFYYDANGNTYRLDSVYEKNGEKGVIKYPSTVGLGFTYNGLHWMFGLDVETTNWSNYTNYGETDLVKNNYTVRAGLQYFPLKSGVSVKKYFNFVKYRMGAYYGTDFVQSTNNHPEYGFSVGAGFPLTSLQRLSYNYNNEFVTLNTAVEFGSRGNKQSNLRDNTLRFSLGIAMNARWFLKPKYN